MLFEPPRTRFDLSFTFAGVPVRVHPLFWLVAVLLGFSARDPVSVVIWVGVVFVSILVHEFGHALAMRHYGESPRIVLHTLGGLTIAEPTPWGRTWANVSPGVRQQILISAAGPGAGFLLAGVVLVVAIAAILALGAGAAFGVAQVPAAPSTRRPWLPGRQSPPVVNIVWGWSICCRCTRWTAETSPAALSDGRPVGVAKPAVGGGAAAALSWP
jgi:membrane-associated protease RseP (regulator of RpoE activity)